MGGIVYNVTVKVDDSVEKSWLRWMRDAHIPDVMATGCFTGHAIFRLKFPVEDEGVTYAIQYRCATMRDLDRYHSKYAAALQKEHSVRFEGRFAAFRTILEEV